MLTISGKIKTVAVLGLLLSIPNIVFSATFSQVVVFFVSSIINPLVIVIIGLAVVYFLWGVAKYILHSGDVKVREEGRDMMIYGVIAIFVMISMWGLVNLLDNTFRLDNDTLPTAGELLR